MIVSPNEQHILEEMIDKYGLSAVLASASEVCTLKSAHVREAWQDCITARSWDTAAKALDRAARIVYAVGIE